VSLIDLEVNRSCQETLSETMIQSLSLFICILFSNTVSNSDYIVLIGALTMNNELKRT
jgi:hypothetical protein